MKKNIGVIIIALGAILLILGVIGIFGTQIGINPYAMAILGVIFFPAGISLMKTTATKGTGE